MRKRVIGLTVLLYALSSCQFIPLYEGDKSVKLAFELNLSSDVEGDAIATPEYFKAGFYSLEDSQLSHTQFWQNGVGDVTALSGSYTLLLYSFGTEYVQIRGENSLETIEAFTSDITASKMKSYRRVSQTKSETEDPIVYTPDHLLVAKENITIPEFTGTSQNISLETEASTVVHTFVFEMKNLTGLEYVESAEAFVTNQARGYFIGRGEASTEACTLWFPVEINREERQLKALFNTFGVLQGEESQTYVHFIMRDTGGEDHNFSMNISKQVASPKTSVIEIEEEIEIPKPPESGGFSPSVDPWEGEDIDVPIG